MDSCSRISFRRGGAGLSLRLPWSSVPFVALLLVVMLLNSPLMGEAQSSTLCDGPRTQLLLQQCNLQCCGNATCLCQTRCADPSCDNYQYSVMCAYYQCAAAAIRQGSCATDPSYSTLYLNVAVQETSCLQLAANLRCSWSDYDLAISCTANLTCRSRALTTCTAACYAQSIQCYKQAGCSGQKDDYSFCAALLKEEALTCDACTLLPTSPGVTLTPVPADTNANSPCINHYRRCNDAVKYNGNAPPSAADNSGSNSTVIIVAISVSLGIVALFTVAVLVFVAIRRKTASPTSAEPTASTSRRNSRGPLELSEQRERAPKETKGRKPSLNDRGIAAVNVNLSSGEEDSDVAGGKRKKKARQGSTPIATASSPTTVFTVSSTLANSQQNHLQANGSQSEAEQGGRIRRSPSGNSRPAWTPETGGISRSPGNAAVTPTPQPIPQPRNSDKYRQDAYATHTDFELDDSNQGRGGSAQPPPQSQSLLSDRQQRTNLLDGSTDGNGNSVRTFSVSQSSAENGLEGQRGYIVPVPLSATTGPLPAPTNGQPRSPNHHRTVSGGSTSSQVSNITTAAPTAARAASKPTMAILKNSGAASPTRPSPPSPTHGGGSGSGSGVFTSSVLDDVPQVTVTGPIANSASFGASVVHITVPEIEEPMMLDELPPYPREAGASDSHSGSSDPADLQVEEADENDGKQVGADSGVQEEGEEEEQEEEEEEAEEVLSESSDLTDEGVAATLGKGRDLTMEDCGSDDGGAHEPQAPVMLKRGNSTVVTEMSDKDIVRHIRMAVWTKGKFLGRGASGSVYITSFPNGFQLALKEIDLSSLSEAELQTTLNEYRKHKTLRHTNLVTCYAVAYDTENKQMQVWTEYMRGGTVSALAQRFSMASEYYPQVIRTDVEPHVLVPEDIVSSFIRQLVDALSYLHQLNIVHGDVKGSNILLSKDEQIAKLCDFGSAKCVVRPSSHSRNQSPGGADTPPVAGAEAGSSTATYNSNPPSTGSSSQQSGGQLRTILGSISPTTRRSSVPGGGLGQFDDAGPSESFENHSLSLSEQPIVGTPQWMAPELIADVVEKSQQLSTGRPSSRSSNSGFTQGRGAGVRMGSANTRRRKRVAYKLASDIWSVGITAAELLLGGSPPFPPFESNWAAIYQLGTGSVHPCLPLGDLTPNGKDFITQCLKINPLDRPTAVQLLKHPWLKEVTL